MFWRVDSTRFEESGDFSLCGFFKIFAFLKLWKNKDRKDKIICSVCRVTFGRMIESQDHDEFIAVRVQDPRVQNEGSWNSYVDFKIFLHTNSKVFTAKTSCVRRRYSEFVWLKKKLQKNTGLVPVPDLPKKSFFSFINDDFIERRRKGLQSFLDQVLHMTVCLSDSQLHLFLQTQLPVKHIEDCVQGHTPYTVTEAILTYASSNRGWVQEEGDGVQELWPTPVPYESVESPAPHLPSLQSLGATSSGPLNELTDVSDSESRQSDAEQTALDLKQGIGHEQLPQEGESYIKLVVEVHSNPVSVETEEEDGNIGSKEMQRLDEDAKDLQSYDCEYLAPQIDGLIEDKLQQGDAHNEEDLDQETSVAKDAVDVTSVDEVTEEKTDDINEAKKGSQDVGLEQDSTVRQTPDKILHEEYQGERIHKNEVTIDLSADAEKLLETVEDVELHDASEENTPDIEDQDKAEITEEHVVQENGVSDEDAAAQEEAMNENEVHVGEVNKLKAKCLKPGSAILILEGTEEVVSTQMAPVTETVSNLDDNTQGERIHKNEVTIDLSADAEKLLETAEDVELHDASEENTPDIEDQDKAEITEEHVVQENGVSDEDAAAQEEAMNENEVHVGEVNKLNAKCLQPGSAILMLEGIEEVVSTQMAPVTETVSNLDDDNTADVNTLVLQAIEMD